MTGLVQVSSLCALAGFAFAAASPVIAGEYNHSHQGNMYSTQAQTNSIGVGPISDPCVLGTNVQPGACVGPVRVAPVLITHGPTNGMVTPDRTVASSSSGTSSYAYSSSSSSSASYSTQVAHGAQPMPPAAVYQPGSAPGMSGCVPGYASAPGVVCHGQWVRAPLPGPAPVNPPPAPPVAIYEPAPMPVPVYAHQPQVIGPIPTSFFTGGITYGAGFPTDQTYTYGGGGYYVAGGGTRFSGVRERATFSLTPPARRSHHGGHRGGHHGGKKGHGCGC